MDPSACQILNPLKPTVTICTTSFNTLKLRILSIEYVCVFYMVLTINCDFSVNNINRSIFVAET
jgi:hypothetical protein